MTPDRALPAVSSALTVLAHPDDESFGLGGVLCALTDAGTRVAGLCYTHGEASTLGAGVDLHQVRACELVEAARTLGMAEVELLGYPDGHLADLPVSELAERVVAAAAREGAELLLVFDEGGITGHPDHRQASQAALVAAERLGLPVLAWTIPEDVAAALNAEFATTFVGRPREETDLVLVVDRARRLQAINCHRSQSTTNPVLRRRLELTGDREPLRWLRSADPTQAVLPEPQSGGPTDAPKGRG